MANCRTIRQVSPRAGLSVVIAVRPGRAAEVDRLLGDPDERFRFYIHLIPAGQPIEFKNLVGGYVDLGPQPQDHVIIQSGGKMWCGYEAFVERVRSLAPHLEDALFFAGGGEDFYIYEFRLSGGELHYRQLPEWNWQDVEALIPSPGVSEGPDSALPPDAAADPGVRPGGGQAGVTAASDAADLPTPCADCRRLVERVAAATDPGQWDEVVGAHPHARPDDPRAATYLRCAACGCCWHIEWQWEIGVVSAEQLSEPEFRRQLSAIRYGPPSLETRAASLLINGSMFLVAVGGPVFVVWADARAGAPWWAGWPWLLACAVAAFVCGKELVSLVRGR